MPLRFFRAAPLSLTRRIIGLVVLGLLALVLVDGVLLAEMEAQAASTVRDRMSATADQIAAGLQWHAGAAPTWSGGAYPDPSMADANGNVGALVLVGSRVLWRTPSWNARPTPPVPVSNDATRVPWWSVPTLIKDIISIVTTPKATAPHPVAPAAPAVFDWGRPSSPDNIHRYARPILTTDPANPVATLIIVERAPWDDARWGGSRDAVLLALIASFLGIGLVQLVALRVVLHPLHRLAADVADVATGRSSRLEGLYPPEIGAVANRFNQVLDHEAATAQTYRKSLTNLAHSLKTPLAVLRATIDDNAAGTPPDPVGLRHQVQRLDDLVSYQLGSAAASGSSAFAPPLAVEPIATSLAEGLEKIHRAKGVLCEFDLDEHLLIAIPPGDLQEILGNLLDNAFKWAKGHVTLSAHRVTLPPPRESWWAAWRRRLTGTHDRPARVTGIRIVVEDDGPGVDAAVRERIFQRGVRADEQVPGHGVGLSIVDDLVRARGGTIAVDSSPDLGGARFEVVLPGHG